MRANCSASSARSSSPEGTQSVPLSEGRDSRETGAGASAPPGAASSGSPEESAAVRTSGGSWARGPYQRGSGPWASSSPVNSPTRNPVNPTTWSRASAASKGRCCSRLMAFTSRYSARMPTFRRPISALHRGMSPWKAREKARPTARKKSMRRFTALPPFSIAGTGSIRTRQGGH